MNRLIALDIVDYNHSTQAMEYVLRNKCEANADLKSRGTVRVNAGVPVFKDHILCSLKVPTLKKIKNNQPL